LIVLVLRRDTALGGEPVEGAHATAGANAGAAAAPAASFAAGSRIAMSAGSATRAAPPFTDVVICGFPDRHRCQRALADTAADPLEPVARPGEFDTEDREADGNDDEGRTRQY